MTENLNKQIILLKIKRANFSLKINMLPNLIVFCKPPAKKKDQQSLKAR